MKELGYGAGYKYAHDYDEKLTDMECLPESLRGKRYYSPTTQGTEARIKERLEQIARWKKGLAKE
jgi:putative ATPase